MIRLFTQKRVTKCGPVAVANVLMLIGADTFGGHAITNRFINTTLSKMLKCKYGTDDSDMAAVLKKIPDIDFEYRKSFNVVYLKKYVQSGGLVVLGHYVEGYGPRTAHYSVVYGYGNKKFSVANYIYGTSTSEVPESEITKVIRQSDQKSILCGFFIECLS